MPEMKLPTGSGVVKVSDGLVAQYEAAGWQQVDKAPAKPKGSSGTSKRKK